MDEHKTLRENWRDLPNDQKPQYFRDYLLTPTLVILAVILAAAYLIWLSVRPEEKINLTVLVVDNQMSEEAKEEILQSLSERFGVEKESLIIGDAYHSSMDSMKIMAQLETGEMDILIAGEDIIENFCGSGAFVSLEEIFTEQELAAFGDSLLEFEGYEGDLEEAGKKHPYGIRVTDSEWFRSVSMNGVTSAAAVTYKGENRETAKAFLEYIMQGGS